MKRLRLERNKRISLRKASNEYSKWIGRYKVQTLAATAAVHLSFLELIESITTLIGLVTTCQLLIAGERRPLCGRQHLILCLARRVERSNKITSVYCLT